MQLLKTVFHVHTDYSPDCDIPVEGLLAEARARGVRCLTVTDHDTIEGARAAAALAGPDLQVIIGEEVSTSQGHLIGLFLHEHIEPGQSARRTAELIRRQGGLVIAPHPFNCLFDCSLRDAVYDVIDLLDAVEVSNAQNVLPLANHRALALAERFNLPMLVGTDAHHLGSLDACHQLLPGFEGPREFVQSLLSGQRFAARHPLSYFLQTAWFTFLEKGGLGIPERYGRNCPYREQPLASLSESA